MSDLMTSIARDWAGKIIGWLLGLGLAVGISVPAETSAQATLALATVLGLVMQMAYYALVRMLEDRFPGAGRLLGVARAPGYGLDMPVRLHPVVDYQETVQATIEAERLKADRARTDRPR